jgi:hypothetical protein
LANAERRGPPGDFKGQRGKPDRVLTRPHPRHGLTSFSANHKPQAKNSIVLPSVDMQADMDAINRGEGYFDPATGQSWINGRRYGMHSDGKAFPMDGDGVILVNRGTFRALTIIRGYNGVTDVAELRMGREHDITADDRAEAIRIWHVREAAVSDDDDRRN